jgi:hypothetical protein
MLPLTDDDYATIALFQHERLRQYYYPALAAAVFHTRGDATLAVSCDVSAIGLLAEDWENFKLFVYLLTGCNATTFYVGGVAVLTLTRAIELQQSVHEDSGMVVAEREQTAVSNGATATAPRTIAAVVEELAGLIAAQAIAQVQASAVVVNSRFATGEFGTLPPVEAAESTPEQEAPVIEAATPAKLPTVRLKGIYTPTRSNWVQSAKRYLKAVDPAGDATKALSAIVEQTPTGLAHLERALREYPPADREAGREKLYRGFLKIAAERGLSVAARA